MLSHLRLHVQVFRAGHPVKPLCKSALAIGAFDSEESLLTRARFFRAEGP